MSAICAYIVQCGKRERKRYGVPSLQAGFASLCNSQPNRAPPQYIIHSHVQHDSKIGPSGSVGPESVCCRTSEVQAWLVLRDRDSCLRTAAAMAQELTGIQHLLQLLNIRHALLHLVEDELLLLLGSLQGTSRGCPASKGLHGRVHGWAATARGHTTHGGSDPPNSSLG